MNLFISFLFLFLSSVPVQAEIEHHRASYQELQSLKQDPLYGKKRDYVRRKVNLSPVSDTADFKYVLLSTESNFAEADQLRYKIAENLPKGVKLVLLVHQDDVERYKKIYSDYIQLNRVIMAATPNNSNGFWARDTFPFPLISDTGQVSLISARYYRDFSAGKNIADSLKLKWQQYDFTFVGGNLMADEQGRCFTVKSSRLFDITESDLKNAYGCKEVIYLKHLSGIGDVDEVIKTLPRKKVLTNQPEYKQQLESLGYSVILLPSIPNSFRTYVNSLIVGQTVFMPVYGIDSDQVATEVYKKLGYKVVGITSNYFSDELNGSVHCQTMAYPAISEQELLDQLNLQKSE